MNRDEIIETPDLVVLLHNYGMAVIAQATRPTDEGQTALGEAAIAIYAHVDAMVPLIRAQIADELRAEARRRDGGQRKFGKTAAAGLLLAADYLTTGEIAREAGTR